MFVPNLLTDKDESEEFVHNIAYLALHFLPLKKNLKRIASCLWELEVISTFLRKRFKFFVVVFGRVGDLPQEIIMNADVKTV